jgi:hypothetical protein
MKGRIQMRMLAAGAAVMAALVGFTATAAAADAHTANWNIPWKDIHYSFDPCKKHMNPFEPQYGGMICKGYYRVDRRNYMFTQDNTNVCPAIGTLEHITLHWVISPDADGIEGKTLVGFSVTSR